MDRSFSLRDKFAGSGFALARRVPDRIVRHDQVRMRGSNKAFFLIFILLTPPLSATAPASPKAPTVGALPPAPCSPSLSN